MTDRKLDIGDELYRLPEVGPIHVRDVFWGWQVEIQRSGNDFFAHRNGFSPETLESACFAAGFAHSIIAVGEPVLLVGYFFKQLPTPEVVRMLGLPPGRHFGRSLAAPNCEVNLQLGYLFGQRAFA